MYIMCLIIFEEKAEIQDIYPLSLNRYRDRLQKYWASPAYTFLNLEHIKNINMTQLWIDIYPKTKSFVTKN